MIRDLHKKNVEMNQRELEKHKLRDRIKVIEESELENISEEAFDSGGFGYVHTAEF